MPKRRILEKLKITEISGVDRPCQEGARVTIMKREDPKVNKLHALEDRVLVLKNRADALTEHLANRAEPAAPIPDFDTVVASIPKRDNCSGTQAFTKARREAPDAFAAFNRLVPKKPAKEDDDFDDLVEAGKDKHRQRVSKSANATADFMSAVDATMIAKRCSRTEALTAARKSNPKLFAAYQEA